jgi:phage/plasmid-associated DNA primase
VFNANTVPIFSDKTQGARRRTLIVPFPARFTDDPDFEEHTFTPRFLGGLLLLILNATRTIRDNGYKYKFSDVTMRAKDDYDSEVNSAEGYLTFLKQSGVEGFVNYRQLRNAYVDWCDENGLVPLGVGNMKRAMKQQGQAENKTIRLEDGSYTKWYLFGFTVTEPSNLVRTDSGLLVGERADNSQQFEQQGLLSGW